MHQKKSKKVLIYFFLLIIVSTISNNSLNNVKFNKIKNIEISGLDKKENKILLKKIKKLNIENIFLINKNGLNNLINSNPVIERYEVFKKYPSTIDIKIEKTKFLAKINIDGKLFLVGSNGKLIPDETNQLNLPFIFGKPSVNEFLKLKTLIDISNFSYKQIKEFYFFPSKRWDLKFDNNILLKLPNVLTKQTLSYTYDFFENYKGDESFIIDARVEGQIILNEWRTRIWELFEYFTK